MSALHCTEWTSQFAVATISAYLFVICCDLYSKAHLVEALAESSGPAHVVRLEQKVQCTAIPKIGEIFIVRCNLVRCLIEFGKMDSVCMQTIAC